MKRIIKQNDSDILVENLNYTNPNQRPRIREILLSEQSFYCAYTEDRFSSTNAFDIEHFNPDHTDIGYNSYQNWFAVCHRWNQIKKDEQWVTYESILYPTAEDLEDRIIYENGYYVINGVEDTPAKNLIDFLDLNNYSLVDQRQKYIGYLRFIEDSGTPLITLFANHPDSIKFRRGIETEFGIQV